MKLITLLIILNNLFKAAQCESVAEMFYQGSLFKLCPDDGLCGNTHFILKFQHLGEIDENGDEINREADDFVTYGYSWTAPTLETDENGVNRTKSATSYTFSIDGDVDQTSTMEFTTYLYHGDSFSVHADQEMDIPIDNLKFTVKVSEWPWLSSNNGLRLVMRLKVLTRNGLTIEADDITVSAVGSNGGIVRFDMGENAFVDSPTSCDVDGSVGTVIPSYASRTDGAYDLIWDFPHYNSTLVYDPVVGYNDPDVPSMTPSMVPSEVPSSLPSSITSTSNTASPTVVNTERLSYFVSLSTSEVPSTSPSAIVSSSAQPTISQVAPIDQPQNGHLTNSSAPSAQPSMHPSSYPSLRPSASPTEHSTSAPTNSAMSMIPLRYCGLSLFVIALMF